MSVKKDNQSHLNVFIKSSVISFIGVGTLGVVNFIVRRYLALNLSVQDFGFLYSAMSLCMIFLAYLDLGLGQSAIILLSKSISERDIKKSQSIYTIFLSVKFIASLVVFLVLAFTYKFWLYDFFKYDETFPYFAIITILISSAIVSAPYAVLIAMKKFILLYGSYISAPLLILIMALTIRIDNKIFVPVIIFPLSSFIVFIILSVFIAKSGFIPRYKHLKEINILKSIFHLSKWVAISTAGLSTMYYLDSLMITYFRSLQEVALYNVALPIMQIAQSLMVIPSVFIPIVSEMWQKKNIKEISDICGLITGLYIYLLWPIVFTIILISKYLIIFLFSTKFIEASNALTILFIGSIFFSLASFYMGTLNAGSNAKGVAISIISGNILNIVLNLALVPVFGIIGAATATALSYFSILVFLTFKMRASLRSFKLRENRKFLLYAALIGIIGVIIALLFRNYSVNVIVGTVIALNLLYFAATYTKLKEYFSIFTGLIKTYKL